MMMRIHILITIIILSFSLKASVAQNNALKVYELVLLVDPISPNDSIFNELKASIHFKVNRLDLAAKVYVKIGTNQGAGNFHSEEFDVALQGGIYTLTSGSNTYQFSGNSVVYSFDFPRANITNITWVTVYAERTNGVLTNEEYFYCK